MKIRILMIEDSAIAATAQKFILSSLGCEIDCVTTGEEGIKMSITNKYDLILMDLGLPDMDGKEASKNIKEAKSEVNNNLIPIVAVTANKNPNEQAKCLAAGMDEVIAKPLTPTKAKEVILRFCNSGAKLA